MSSQSTEHPGVPPGWYPDPSGGLQWRAWNGREWTGLTRAYGDVHELHAEDVVILGVLRRLRWSALPALYVGLGLLVGAMNERPSHVAGVVALSTTSWTIMISLSLGLILGATVAIAVALRLLEDRVRMSQFLPLISAWRLTRVLAALLRAETTLVRWQVSVSVISFVIALATLNPWMSGLLLLYPYAVQDSWIARTLAESGS